MTHFYNIKKWGIGRFKQPCNVLARGRGPGPRNVLIQFADGHRLVTIRHAVRRITNSSTIKTGTVDR